MREGMEQLSWADREILTWRYELDYNADEVACLLGVNATAVHMRLRRARQRLADRLAAQGVGRLPCRGPPKGEEMATATEGIGNKGVLDAACPAQVLPRVPSSPATRPTDRPTPKMNNEQCKRRHHPPLLG